MDCMATLQYPGHRWTNVFISMYILHTAVQINLKAHIGSILHIVSQESKIWIIYLKKSGFFYILVFFIFPYMFYKHV